MVDFIQNALQTHLYSVQLGIWATTPGNPDGGFMRLYATSSGLVLQDETGTLYDLLVADSGELTLQGVTVEKNGANVEIAIVGDAGKYRTLAFYTDGNVRWGLHANDATETGSGNAGSNLQINRHADDGSFIAVALTLFRSNGNLYLGGDVEIDGAINHDGTQIGFNGNTPVTRQTYGAPTGTLSRSALTDSSTTSDVRNVLKALITDLRSRGDLG